MVSDIKYINEKYNINNYIIANELNLVDIRYFKKNKYRNENDNR